MRQNQNPGTANLPSGLQMVVATATSGMHLVCQAIVATATSGMQFGVPGTPEEDPTVQKRGLPGGE